MRIITSLQTKKNQKYKIRYARAQNMAIFNSTLRRGCAPAKIYRFETSRSRKLSYEITHAHTGRNYNHQIAIKPNCEQALRLG